MDKHWIRFSLRWSEPLLKSHERSLLLLFVLMTVSVILSLFKVNFVQQSIDAVIARDTAALFKVFWLFIVITALRLLQGYWYTNRYNRTFFHMEKELKDRFTAKLLQARMKDIDLENSGDLGTKSSSDIPGALAFIKETFSNFLLNPIMTMGGFVYLCSYSWKLSLAVFVPFPVLVVLLNRMSDRTSNLYRGMQGLRSDYSEQIYDIIHGAQTIKAYNMQRIQLQKVTKTLLELLKKNKRYDINIAITLALIMAVTYVPMVTVFLYGAYLVSHGEIQVSLLFAYSQLIPLISTPVINLFSCMVRIKNAYQSMRRLDTVLELEEEKKGGALPEPGKEPAIRFDHVQFGYDADHMVLTNLNLCIPRGQCVGLTSGNGEGKSTILQLLCGLYTVDGGTVEVFGQNIQNLDLEQLRKQIAYVPQDAYILPGSLEENIRFGNMDASEKEIQQAVEWAELAEYVNALPKGLHTEVSEGGENLSGGQKQRLSLARAFLKEAAIYIFDEPTASLDPETEKQIVEKMAELVGRKDVTSIIISHTPRPLSCCDAIYSLQNGRLERRGA